MLSFTESISADETAVDGALCAEPPPRIAPPRPRFGFAMIWTGPLCPKPLCAAWLEIMRTLEGEGGGRMGGKITHVVAAGRKPATGCIPGAGGIVGWGPNRGLNGACSFCTWGAFGFVDAWNCGFVKLRQAQNSTVDPRYCEHLANPSLHKGINRRRTLIEHTYHSAWCQT